MAIEITQLLHKHNCTYNESDKVLELAVSEIKQQREDLEYETVDDFLKNKKTYIADNHIIRPLHHVEPYC